MKQKIGFNNIIKLVNSKLNNFETKLKRPFLISYPQTIFIEVTNNCNLNCSVCARKYWDNSKNKLGYFEFNNLKKIISFLKHSRTTVLHGHGEPLLATHIWDIANFCYKYGSRTMFTTNGILINEENRKRIMASKINEIRLSVDGANEETVYKIRGVSFNKIIENFIKLAERRDKINAKIPNLGLSLTLMKSNIEELPKLIDICKKYNFNFIFLQHLNVYSKEFEQESLFLYPEYLKKQMEIIKELCYKKNIELRTLQKNSDFCEQPFKSIIIRWNGEIRYCCSAIFNNNEYSFSGGSLYDHKLKNLWNSEIIQKIRKGFSDNKPFGACNNCSFITKDHLAHIRNLKG